MMLSRHCNSLALEYAGESENQEIQFTIRNNLAVLDLERQNYQECFDQCMDLWYDEDFQPDLDQQAMVLNNLTVCAMKLKNTIAADSLFPQLFAISESELLFEQFDPILPYRNYGLYLRQSGRDEEACRYFRIALNRYLIIGSAQNELIRINAYRARACFWYSLSRADRALADIEKAIDRIEFIMRSYAATESGFAVAMIVRPVYNLALELALTLYQENNEKAYFFKALMYSDQAKRMSLQANYQNQHKVELSPQLEEAYRSFYTTRLALSTKHESPSDLADLVQQHSENRIITKYQKPQS